jgi:hypothetical protein
VLNFEFTLSDRINDMPYRVDTYHISYLYDIILSFSAFLLNNTLLC